MSLSERRSPESHHAQDQLEAHEHGEISTEAWDHGHVRVLAFGSQACEEGEHGYEYGPCTVIEESIVDVSEDGSEYQLNDNHDDQNPRQGVVDAGAGVGVDFGVSPEWSGDAEESDEDGQEDLGEHAVHDGEQDAGLSDVGVLAHGEVAGDAQAAEDSLDDHDDQSGQC